MSALELSVAGVGFWAPGTPTWDALRAQIRTGEPHANAPARPQASVLPPAERRRAPDPVLVACDIAAQACAAAARAADSLPCMFASTHGDLAITDYMCTTLAAEPRELSPTKFHNSVHNAPAGYWTIATGCRRASTAISGWHHTVGATLIEAASQALADDEPVLVAIYDTPSPGALADIAHSGITIGLALVLAPLAAAQGKGAKLTLRLREGRADRAAPRSSPLAALAKTTPLGDALALAEALAAETATLLSFGAGEALVLDIEVVP